MYYPIISYQDTLYTVIRVFKDYPEFPIQQIQDRLAVCDKVLRKQGKLYFCRTIQDVLVQDEPLQLVEKGS